MESLFYDRVSKSYYKLIQYLTILNAKFRKLLFKLCETELTRKTLLDSLKKKKKMYTDVRKEKKEISGKQDMRA